MKARMFFTLYLIMVLVGIGTCLCLGAYTKESLEFISCEFYDSPGCIGVLLTIKNTGTTDLWIVEVTSNLRPCWHDPRGLILVRRGETLRMPVIDDWPSDYPYTINLITKRGNVFSIHKHTPKRQPPLEIENVTWGCASNTVSVVVRNVGSRDRNITHFRLGDAPDDLHLTVTIYTDNTNGIHVLIDQKATIVLDWPSNWSPWISDKTYCFCIYTETGPETTFTSRPP